MSRLTPENVITAEVIISRYPVAKSALIPLLHLAQEQDGYVTADAMEHIAELVDVTPAQVLSTCSFYEMFKAEPLGKYLVTICTNVSCKLMGADQLLKHAEESLGVHSGGTTDDQLFTLEEVECLAACTEGPCMQINYHYAHRVTNEDFDTSINSIRDGVTDIAPHGQLSPVRQASDNQCSCPPKAPSDHTPPDWFARRSPGTEVAIDGK